MTDHVDWDTLNDYVDGRLPAAARESTAWHLDACDACRDTLAELRCLLAAASDVPDVIAPPAGLWGDVRATIESRRLVPLVRPWSPHWASPRRLAAAAVLLIVLSSGITALVMRSGGATHLVAADSTRRANDSSVTSRAVPVAFAETERSYLASVDELQALFDLERGRLAPATVATVERSLAAVDNAIREARAALVADPANRDLLQLLSTNYRQKVELLQRVAEYSRTS